MAMTRFLLVWIVFSTKNIGGYFHQVTHRLLSALKTFFCWVLRFCNVRLVLAIARGLCFLGVLGREFRHQNPVATQNFSCLTGQKGRIDASWIAVRRKILEASATWAQNPKVLQQLAACTQQLDEAVAPLRLRKNAVILAPLHSISDVLAAMVAAGVTPGRASVIVSSSAEQYNARARALGGVNLSYCSIHQDSK
ncbi:MAG: ABC transporter, partial [Hafniaceae bacterium]|nr:ABC transporter [Hafniaceae bacterium]